MQDTACAPTTNVNDALPWGVTPQAVPIREEDAMPRARKGFSRREVLKTTAGLAAVGAAPAVTGFPNIARGAGSKIRIGMPTILSGRVAILGTSSQAAVAIATEQFNAKGGVGGREVELVVRDSKGKPDEAAKVVRDLINNDGCEIIIDAEASSGAFAVHEVIRETGVLCIHSNSETSELTANPELRVPTAFRGARQGIHDAVGGGKYAAEIARAQDLKLWMSCSPDYAYGRGNTAEFFQYLKHFEPSAEVVDEVWPKLFQPDYTETVTKILQAQPQAIYSALWGGDLVSFVEQANLYSLFGSLAFFSSGLGDPPVLSAIKSLPKGLNTVYRYSRNFPDNPDNLKFAETYHQRTGQDPTNWAWQNHLSANFIFAALESTGGSTDGAKLADALKGRKIETPFGVDGTITMRGEDHTIVHYPVAWGVSISEPPYVENFVPADWAEIFELETAWKKEKGWA